MDSVARFHFVLTDGSPLVLSFGLQENSLKDRWVEMVKRRNNNQEIKFNLTLSNKSKEDLPEMKEKLNVIISKLNQTYDRPMPLCETVEDITRERLNRLHEEFENYGARLDEYFRAGSFGTTHDAWYTKDFDQNIHETWLKLNEQIHMTEAAMGCDPDEPHYMCATQYYPFERGCDVNPEDKLFLTTDMNWGELYLGYNTLGKDYMDTCWDNDVRVVTNDQIKIQEQFSTEVYLNFSFNRYKKSMEQEFWVWYKGLDPDTQKLIPIHDRNALSLGRYYLGAIMFDKTFYDFYPNFTAWENGNIDLRKKWNIEVFSKIDKIVKIEVVPLDEYENLMLQYDFKESSGV